jgi:threonine dehydrogenase-like Zn-dependent dehydrogenase
MRAVRGSEGRVEVVDVAAPTGEGVRVRIRSAGICGSDLHMLAGGYPTPNTLGHEMAGLLDDDTPVAIEPLVPCERCEACREGRYNLCARGPGMLLGVGLDGGMAEEVRVPERCLVPLPRGVPVEDASLVEPLAVAIHGLCKVGLRPGERTAVVGGGSIGLCAVAAARDAGADVGLAARHDHQRAAAERLGAHEAAGEYALVIDCAGTKSSLESALALCRPGARLLLLSTFWEGLELPAIPLFLKEVDVIPSNTYARHPGGRDVDAAAALLATSQEVASAMITHRFPLEAAPEAFATARDRKAGAIKVVLEP